MLSRFLDHLGTVEACSDTFFQFPDRQRRTVQFETSEHVVQCGLVHLEAQDAVRWCPGTLRIAAELTCSSQFRPILERFFICLQASGASLVIRINVFIKHLLK